MEINRTNFTICLSEILSFLDKVEFASISLLPTGQYNPENISQFDNSLQRFQKLVNSPRKIQIMKIGFSFFLREHNSIITKSYNISLFPQTFNKKYDQEFDLSIRLIEQLKNQKFDFSAWITKGVPYFTTEQQKMIIENHTFNSVEFFLENPHKIPQQNLPLQLEIQWSKIIKWIESGDENEHYDFYCRSNEDKRTILQKINHDYEHLIEYLFIKEIIQENLQILRFQKCSKIKKKMLQKKTQNEIQSVIDQQIGFSSLWNKLKRYFTEKNKLIVGWDLFESFFLMVTNFEKKLCWKDYRKFKTIIAQEMFGKVCDVKLIAKKNGYPVQNFENLFQKLFEENKKHLPKFDFAEAADTPAFQSYQKGCIFLLLRVNSFINILNCLALHNNETHAMKLDQIDKDKILEQNIYKLEPLIKRKDIKEFQDEMELILESLQKKSLVQEYELLKEKNQIFVKLKFKVFILKKLRSSFKEKANLKSLQNIFTDSFNGKISSIELT